MGNVINVLISMPLWVFPLLGFAAKTPRAVLVSAQHKKFICNAVVYRSQKVLVPLHCLSDLDPKNLEIRSIPGNHFHAVTSIRSLVDREGYFPNYDIAVLNLLKPWPNFQELKDWTLNKATAGSFVMESIRPDQTQVVKTPFKWLNYIQGPRLSPLILMEAQGRNMPCYGDSGSAVYFEANSEKRLVGFLTGLSYPLTSSSFRCDDPRRVITPLEPYKNWIMEHVKDSIVRQESKAVYLTIEDLCKGQNFSDDSWPLMQIVILSLFPAEQQKPNLAPLVDALVNCKGLKSFWETATTALQPIKFEAVASPKQFRFLNLVKNASFESVDQNDLNLIAQWQALEILTLNGVEAGIDFTILSSLNQLKQLKILHSEGFKGLAHAMQKLPNIQTLTLFNAKAESPTELEALQDALPRLKIFMEKEKL